MVKKMTNKEAIDLLSNLIGMVEDTHGNDYNEAFHMAICSLEAWNNFYEWLKKLQEQQEEIDGGVSVLTSIHLQPLIEAVEKIFGGTV